MYCKTERDLKRLPAQSFTPKQKFALLVPHSASGGILQLPWVRCSRAQPPLHLQFPNIQLKQVQKGEDKINFQLEMKDNHHLPTHVNTVTVPSSIFQKK